MFLGIIRQKYPEVSRDYDRQMIINPVFYGFKVRWRGRVEDESKFTSPIFWGYTYNKKPLSAGNVLLQFVSNFNCLYFYFYLKCLLLLRLKRFQDYLFPQTNYHLNGYNCQLE